MKFGILIAAMLITPSVFAQGSTTLCDVTVRSENVITKPSMTFKQALKLYTDSGYDVKVCSLGGSAVMVYRDGEAGKSGAIIF